jgi:hypothetical protein
MAHDKQYGTPAITCEAANGICHYNQKCGLCFHADKYEERKVRFAKSAKCEWKKEGYYCMKDQKECNTLECKTIL